ncbi:hypothetical protein CCR75_007200 [Bremia lactucae]|uniref:peptidylprolyl isomerase n=1 Tax=Bremia lactucae TaxID=4779 RepID=A0A976FFE3_BRELC|nr:hypothetical protein CCR75_007200 [Bremia lactucae]
MSDAPSDSPASSGGLGTSLMWEKVSLSPLEILSVQLEHDLQLAEEAATSAAHVKQNKYGVDMDSNTNKATGRMFIEVVAVNNLALDKNATVQAVSGNAQPNLYVSTVVSPLSAFEKTTKKHLRTSVVQAVDNAKADWEENLVHVGAKTKKFVVKVSLSCKAEVIADVVLGELELRSTDYEDQMPHEQWLNLKAPALAATSGIIGKIQLRVRFEFSARERYENQVALLRQKKYENDNNIERYKKTARLVKASVQHPAAFGNETAQAALYVPGNKFHMDAHHPAAISIAPLADKTRIVTPFGRGVVVSFRPLTRMYVVLLDTNAASKNQTIAYLQQDIVKEESDEPDFRMHMKVLTPYGLGVVKEIRSCDDVIVVETDFAHMFMQRKDIKLPVKELADMSTKDLLQEAAKLADVGNDDFRDSKLQNAVHNYLRSLGFLQRVDQDEATHKEKATIIQTMIRCHLNIGACKLKLNMFTDAEVACTNALGILTVLAENRDGNVVTWMGRLGMSEQLLFEDWPSKARFRRAQACVKLEKYTDAKQDLLLAVRLNPRDKSCRTLLDKVSKLLEKQKRDEMKAWGGIFDNLEASPSTIKTATKTTTTKSSGGIFTRKAKKQGERSDAIPSAGKHTAWYLTMPALVSASVVTAGVAAMVLLTLKKTKSS